jgi:hypothetical protein
MNARRLLTALFSLSFLAATVACGSAATEDDTESDEGAFSQADVDRDPTLKKLQAAASNVNKYEISVKGIDVPVPNASQGASVNGFSTRGLDWFQNPNVSYPDNKSWDQGTPTGKKCQWAAIFRFQAIFENPPAEAKEMLQLEGGRWRGSFWSWIDDYASTNSAGDPSSSYAWSSGLWKWIGASGKNDTCRLPTKTMVAGMMKACMQTARDNNGDPKGCRMPRYNPAIEPADDAGAGDGGSGEGGSDGGSSDAASDARDGGSD